MDSYPKTWREILDTLVGWAEENRTQIIRKSDFRRGSSFEAPPTPILSISYDPRECFGPDTGKLWTEGANYAYGASTFYWWGGNPLDPLTVPTPRETQVGNVADVSTLGYSDLVLLADGSVVDLDGVSLPTEVASGAVAVEGYSLIDSGSSFVLLEDGTIWAKGDYLPGMNNSSGDPYDVPWGPWTLSAYAWSEMPTDKVGEDVVAIAAVGGALAWMLSDETIRVWRNNEEDPHEPTGRPSGITKIAAGFSHVLVLTDSGEIWSAGGNQEGEAGLLASDVFEPGGPSNNYSAWRKALGDGYTDVAGGGQQATIAVKDGRLYTWGEGGPRSARGEGATRWGAPVEITEPDASDVTSVYGNWATNSLYYQTADGCLYVWGLNIGGSLGLGYAGDPNVARPTRLLVDA